MAVTDVASIDISQELAEVLTGVEDLRPYWYVSDAVRPPAVVIGMPSVDFQDTLGGFCASTWSYPLTLVVGRNNDREAQKALSHYLQLVTTKLAKASVPSIQLIEPVDARPITVSINGQDLPAYALTVRVRA
jgi:hypothetical protein